MDNNTIIAIISRIREKANKFLIDEMEKNNIKGLVTSHGNIIFSLFKNPKLTMKDLSRITGKDKSTITALINKLKKSGYIKKIKNDKDTRITNISLTDKGKSLEPKLRKISDNLIKTAYKGINDNEKKAVVDILQKIKGNF